LHHWRYFKLLGLSKKERKEEIRRRRWKYTWYATLFLEILVESGFEGEMLTKYRFGSIALLLQLVPVFSMFFLLTTACGSALWVVKLEEQKRLVDEALVRDGEIPGPYTDDPV
jgi:hypothetical protein